MKDITFSGVERMVGIKVLVLTLVVFTLTLAKPAASMAHVGAQKVCSLVMQSGDCAKHC